ncbi:MAG: hypothetical protein LCI00_22895 [Chloroflexi bacterium]|nr:hypothetical protein [Chloroflexota bacterium]MCC6895902.1 hypothetical protein [Anaerolineae bacterium]
MPIFIETFLYELRQRFLLRWVLANVVGWTVGLYAGVLNPVCFAGTGIIAGLVLGAAQWWALRGSPLLALNADGQPSRRWITLTFAGAATGLIPAAVLGGMLFLFTNGVAALLAGAVLGGAVGLGQWAALQGISSRAVLWLGVNILGGAVCGLLTIIPIIRGLPLGLLAGAALFGYATGRVLEMMRREGENGDIR